MRFKLAFRCLLLFFNGTRDEGLFVGRAAGFFARGGHDLLAVSNPADPGTLTTARRRTTLVRRRFSFVGSDQASAMSLTGSTVAAVTEAKPARWASSGWPAAFSANGDKLNAALKPNSASAKTLYDNFLM
jgi:hypothetical protein